jgi:hypothetical protein
VLLLAHVFVFQSVTFVSVEPLASKPLLLKATVLTSSEYSKVLISAPVSAFQIFIFVSGEALASKLLLLKATDKTMPLWPVKFNGSII